MNSKFKPTVISTFCGVGGSSLGYKMAGYKELLAVDFDKTAAEWFGKNFPGVPIWNKSVADIKCKTILKACGIKKGQLDVLDGSPPCQGFSTAGKRRVEDERNDLFTHYVRLVKGLQPKVFVMENVTGMVKGTMKGKFREILGALKALPYVVHCRQMNSKYYGVPQSRERIIFIGVRKDLKRKPAYPTPNENLVTAGEALEGLVSKRFAKRFKGQEKILSYIPPGKSAIKYAPKHLIKKYIPRMYKNKNFVFDGYCKRISLKRPCGTITATFGPFSSHVHPTENRFLSIEEILAFSSFPQNWKLPDNFDKAWKLIGNSVMPKFMMAIAKTIKTEILMKGKK